MGYPWYAHGTLAVGANQKAAVRMDRHCDTKQIRYRLDVIKDGGGKKSFSATMVKELREKVNKWLETTKISLEAFNDAMDMLDKAEDHEAKSQKVKA